MIAIQLVKLICLYNQCERLRDLHGIGFIHNDIKPENILADPDNGDTLYLIDFGLSQKYLNNHSEHIKHKQLNTFTGNFMFASVNSCKGYNKSRKDDIESAFYMIVFLLNRNTLPWNFLCKDNYSQKKRIKMRINGSFTS